MTLRIAARSALLLSVLALLPACKADPPKSPTTPVETAAAPKPVPQLKVEVEPSQRVIAADKEAELFVRVRLTGLKLESDKRPPINLVLVADTSGSMVGAPIEREKEACAKLVDALGKDDTLSIVTFGTKPRVLVPAAKLDAKTRAQAKTSIASIVAEGTTDLSGGLATGLSELGRFWAADRINRVVLLGDGVPNDPAAIPAHVARAQSMNAPITSLGLGPEFDETLMAKIAQDSGAAFHFIDDASRVSSVFEQEITQMKRLAARSARVELSAGPGVEILEVVGVPASVGKVTHISVGDLGEGQVRDLVVRVKVAPRKDGANVELLDASIGYSDVATNVAVTGNAFRAITASANAGSVTEGRNAEVEHLAARLQVADGIVQSIALARGGDVNAARALLDRTIKIASSGAKTFDDAELEKKAKEARDLKKTIHTLAPPPEVAESPSPHPGKPVPMMPKPVAMEPDVAMSMKRAHGEAMRSIQGM
ncbi:MAG: VWA domain-containing protein [Polyangiaceae bacterium]|nr:VWA domain-containing protein [Polyangiaceae bacterium]